MGLPAVKQKLATPEEYFALRETSEERYEYQNGEILMMGRTLDAHNELTNNAFAAIKSSVKGRGCKVYTESIAVEVEDGAKYYLPDVFLTCDKRDHQDRKIKRNPSLIIEVLSESSIERDRGEKFLAYLKLESLRYYLLISQDQIRIEVYAKQVSGKGWYFNYYESLEDVISLDQLGIELRVADVYEDVLLINADLVETEEEDTID